ncbi:hypothetical protein [Glycomyces sp. NPDC047010]|uniref:hypothetical protein n=1 Tax=Glycomyces sp. NPDC047010 TaxID=3155023 RepID=UPI0033F1EDA9
MGERATATAVQEAGAGGNVGQFHLDAPGGGEWTYRMYLHGADTIVVHRAHPDPATGRYIATATNLDRLDAGGAVFDFPADWAENGNAVLAEAAIIDAYRRIADAAVSASIRFGEVVLVMTTAPGMNLVRVEEATTGPEPRWAATLTAPHRDYMAVQVSWNGPDFGHVLGTDAESNPGRANRFLLARAGSALWRSVNRDRLTLPRQPRADDVNEGCDLLNG